MAVKGCVAQVDHEVAVNEDRDMVQVERTTKKEGVQESLIVVSTLESCLDNCLVVHELTLTLLKHP